jgi:hypothetical protein
MMVETEAFYVLCLRLRTVHEQGSAFLQTVDNKRFLKKKARNSQRILGRNDATAF